MLLVDVREPNETAVESYPEGVIVPLSRFDPAAIPDPEGREVVFACRSGKRSVTASLVCPGPRLSLPLPSRRRYHRLEGSRTSDQTRQLILFRGFSIHAPSSSDRRPGRGRDLRVRRPCRRARPRRQRLQLVGLHRSGRAEGVHRQDRHQGALRHLRRQRDAGDQAARRPFRLRRGGADRLFPAAADPGRRVPEARQEQAAEPEERVAGDRQAARGLRSRQPIRRQLHVGHHRHRLQRQGDASAARGQRQDRQLGRGVQAGEPRQVQGLRHPHAGFVQRHHAGGAALSRARSELDQAGRSRDAPPRCC